MAKKSGGVESAESKSLALLRILNILERYSDSDHRLTQQQIIDYLERDYGICIERKNVGRKIAALQSALEKEGVIIESDKKKGTYLDTRRIENSELRMLIDAVLSSRYIAVKHSKDLINKLCSLANVYFKSHASNIYSVSDWNKTENQAVFYNVELADEAITRKKRISFNYNKYGVNKKLQITARHEVSPYQMFLHNQQYYLMAHNETWSDVTYYKLDRITDMCILEDSVATDIRSLPGYENGINYREIANSRPYMYSDKLDSVTFLCDKGIIDYVIERFGTDISVFTEEDGKLKITVKVSPAAMRYWAMQYLNYVEVLTPTSLREAIAADLRRAVGKYE